MLFNAGSLVDNDQLAAKMRGIPPTAPGLMQLLSFSWGVVLSTHGPDDCQSKADTCTDMANPLSPHTDTPLSLPALVCCSCSDKSEYPVG